MRGPFLSAHRRKIVAFLLALAPSTTLAVEINDNRRAAGELRENVLTLRLYVGEGSWRPEGPLGPSFVIAAFGEENAELSVPGPVIRVREGTAVKVVLRNALQSTLRINGFCPRPAKTCDPMMIAPGASQEGQFTLGSPGTYYYYGTTGTGPLFSRPQHDTQLVGAIVVDPAAGSPPDRVFILSTYGRPPGNQPRSSKSDVFAINGVSWPHTEMQHYKTEDQVHWRVINLSFVPHAMHLHGMYFNVDAAGDISTQQQFVDSQRRKVATQLIGIGQTFNMSWSADRPGNWLFHCHMTFHMHKEGHNASHQVGDQMPDKSAGMAGMVLGIEVSGPPKPNDAQPNTPAPRQMSLILTEEPNRYGDKAGFRMSLEGTDAPRLNTGAVPGPVIVLARGEPVEITVVNRLSQATAMHWHGIELDSFYDGVAGWSGQSDRQAPPILPGESFVAKFTPPRAGTFIYHTHWHDDAQLAGGLYGPLIVLEPGEKYDPETDHIVVIGLNGVIQEDQWATPSIITFNGKTTPDPIIMRADVPNRLRLINITANGVSLWVLLQGVPFDQGNWKPVAKDGATLPDTQAQPRPARQVIAVGETYDFELVPSGSRSAFFPLWLELRRSDGGYLLEAPIRTQQ